MAQEPSSPRRLIFVPNVLRRQGWGHFRRCLNAALALKAEIYLALSFFDHRKTFSRKELEIELQGCSVLFELPLSSSIDLAIVDFQKTPSKLFRALRQVCAVLVGWDEGGLRRVQFPFLVDSLPNAVKQAPNEKNETLLGLVKAQENLAPLFDARKDFNRVLVVFGGADPQGLTLKTLKLMKKSGFFTSKREITVVKGPAARFQLDNTFFPFRLWKNPDNLSSRLSEFDLVITSWGLTALEALACGVPVILSNPSSYHDFLAKKKGLSCFGEHGLFKTSFSQALKTCLELSQVCSAKLCYTPQSNPAAHYFGHMTFSSPLCPVCRVSSSSVIYRTPHKTYYHCFHCGIDFLQTFNLASKTYCKTYFFEDYQAQYGRTYLEDFSSIKALGLTRLAFARKKGLRLKKDDVVLDVGCAYGPFLQAVSEQGSCPLGLDVCSQAVNWVGENLGFQAFCGSFLEFDFEQSFPRKQRPQLITLWYVIEHFEHLERVLSKINKILPLGGWLGFSTPHGRGISRRFDPARFWTQSPNDHFSIWNRPSARKVLKRFGFRLRGFRLTGQHPERFPWLAKKKGLGLTIISFLDKLFGWGDTFEVYAEKMKTFSKDDE